MVGESNRFAGRARPNPKDPAGQVNDGHGRLAVAVPTTMCQWTSKHVGGYKDRYGKAEQVTRKERGDQHF